MALKIKIDTEYEFYILPFIIVGYTVFVGYRTVLEIRIGWLKKSIQFISKKDY